MIIHNKETQNLSSSCVSSLHVCDYLRVIATDWTQVALFLITRMAGLIGHCMLASVLLCVSLVSS